MHISTSPLLLQRYSKRAADAWQAATGYRPGISKHTGVSFKFRSYQEVVNPDADSGNQKIFTMQHKSRTKDVALKGVLSGEARTRWKDR